MTNPAYEATNSISTESLVNFRNAIMRGEKIAAGAFTELIIEELIAARNRMDELESAPNGMMQLSNELAEMKRKCVELQEQKDKWAVWEIALGAKADELESRPLCVKSNDAMREAAPLCVKLPDWWANEYMEKCLYYKDVVECIEAHGITVEGSE